MRRCRVCAAIRSTPTPATAAVVREPGIEDNDRIGAGAQPGRDANDLASGFGVGLRAAQMQQQPVRPRLDVGEGEGSEFRATQGAGEAEQDDRGAAAPGRCVAVDGGEESMDLLGSDRVSGSAWSGAEDPVQSAAYLADRLGLGRVGQSVVAVLVPDGGAGQVDGRCRGTVCGTLGEIRAHHSSLGAGHITRHLTGQPGGVGGTAAEWIYTPPGTPFFPGAPGTGVDGAGGLGVGGADRGGNPGGIVFCEQRVGVGVDECGQG